MTERTRESIFGKHRPFTEFTCGHDGGDDNAPTCGARAIWHGWPGDWGAGVKAESATVYCCDDHFAVLDGKLWDHHPVGGACGIPGALWMNGTGQGEGFCRSEMGEDITLMVESALEIAHDTPENQRT